ncbi:MAG: shikimate dehydrogenase [Oscillospiraceae bacterium]|nr:shikimate dehydrogenase [Oscillospiraceae bacterium]
MKRYGLAGYPLGHSMSPVIHQRLSALEDGEDSRYRLLEIPPDRFDTSIKEMFELDGFNITIPHKLAIIPHLDRLDRSAEKYRAVNTVKCDGRIGYNTDVEGFRRSVESLGISSFAGTRVLILGSGGTGRMAAIESASGGAELTIAVRESGLAKAEQLRGEIYTDTGKRVIITTHGNISGEFDLLVNTTPAGMYPDINKCCIGEDIIKKCVNVFDVIYNPAETMLMRIARSHGIRVCGGMTMLVWQAAAARTIWNGARYNPDDIAAIIESIGVK